MIDSLFEPLKTETRKKCKSVIAESKELTRIVVISVETPIGVTVVAVLTLYSTFALGFIPVINVVTIPVGVIFWLPLWAYYLPLFFGLFAFVSSYSILSDKKWRLLWYSSIAYWIALFVYFVWFYTSGGIWGYMWNSIVGILLYSTPFIYTIGSPIYFFTNKPREYFHIKK